MNGRCTAGSRGGAALEEGADKVKNQGEKQIPFGNDKQGVSGRVRDLRARSALCYKRHMREMREWMRDLMRRRSRRGPNNSESTGKSGQELPQNQPAPLRPSYPEPLAPKAAQAADSVEKPEAAAAAAAEPEKRMVVETQPESLATPPGEQAPVSPKEPRG